MVAMRLVVPQTCYIFLHGKWDLYSMKKILFLFLLVPSVALAEGEPEVIEFDEEELATETVLPIFDNSVSVRNRNIEKAGRFEIGINSGLTLAEAFYDQLNYGGHITYHLSESHAISGSILMWNQGLSNYGEQLQNGEGLDGITFDASRAPAPEQWLSLNYHYSAYYGKMSVSKQSVVNTTLFGTVGLGMINNGDSQLPALNVGVGQNFYLTKNFALRWDLLLLMFQGPDPTTVQPLLTGGEELSGDSFDEELYTNPLIQVGISYML